MVCELNAFILVVFNAVKKSLKMLRWGLTGFDQGNACGAKQIQAIKPDVAIFLRRHWGQRWFSVCRVSGIWSASEVLVPFFEVEMSQDNSVCCDMMADFCALSYLHSKTTALCVQIYFIDHDEITLQLKCHCSWPMAFHSIYYMSFDLLPSVICSSLNKLLYYYSNSEGGCAVVIASLGIYYVDVLACTSTGFHLL